MISFLVGKPLIHGNFLTILANGVGYDVKVSAELLTKARLSSDTNEFALHIYTHVREEQLVLFGFEKLAEKSLFLLILSVSGVGPAIALQVVAAGSEKVVEAVQQAQVAFFTAIPRVGKKLAQKIIIELSSKLGEMKQLQLETLSTERTELSDTLIGLGFDQNGVFEVVQSINVESVGVEAGLKEALKKLKN